MFQCSLGIIGVKGHTPSSLLKSIIGTRNSDVQDTCKSSSHGSVEANAYVQKISRQKYLKKHNWLILQMFITGVVYTKCMRKNIIQ